MFERIGQRLAGSVLFWDLVATLIGLYVTSKMRILLPFGYDLHYSQVQLPIVLYLAVAVIWTVIFLILTPQRAIFTSGLPEAIGRLLLSVGLAGLSFAGLLYLSPFRDVSRLQFLYFIISNLIVLLTIHLVVRVRFRARQSQRWRRRILIVGGGSTGRQIARELSQRHWAGLQVVGYTSDELVIDAQLPVLGELADTVSVVEQKNIDEVIFALPPQQHERVVEITLQLQRHPVMVHTVPGLIDLAFARTAVDTLGGIPLISLRESALTEPQRLIKRFFDILLSSVALVLLAPVMLLIAILIKLDSPGPIFFTQERVGEHGKRFKMVKFRSMYQHADTLMDTVVQRDALGNLLHKHALDPRVTRIGQKLRRTSLDELPQLINVLRGEMSLVGPRPEIPCIVAEYQSWQWQRFRIPPGMTGWWQINGRSNKPMHLHTEEDLFYVQNYSFWLDLQILLKTIIVVWRGHGAY